MPFEVIVKCSVCPMEVRRRLEDLDDPTVPSADWVVGKHTGSTAHQKFFVEVHEAIETATIELELGIKKDNMGFMESQGPSSPSLQED